MAFCGEAERLQGILKRGRKQEKKQPEEGREENTKQRQSQNEFKGCSFQRGKATEYVFISSILSALHASVSVSLLAQSLPLRVAVQGGGRTLRI
ncbi:hypothetical protein L6164_036073 [Bauhinia variegata]|uniref:Uncharacterized protein n=1 Tax=Bauhinia variegata TaxID=167791 RepID=A0ACB9KFW3_BAUVA|nr:hypothetical protein L6164_036073 [Bauhinia variegata]